MDTLFDNRQELSKPKFQHVARHAGVWISAPFFHNGLKQQCVSTQTHYPYLSDECFGNPGLPVEDVELYKAENTKEVIERIDDLIKELKSIKESLFKSLKPYKQPSLFD